MNLTELQDGIYEWLAAELDPRLVIFADQDANQATRPFATIKIISVTKLGVLDEQGTPDDDGIAIIKGHREASVQIQAYGPGAMQMILDARDSLNKWSVLQDLFYDKELAVVGDATVTDVSAILETEIEERAALDLVFRFATELEDDVGIIETVEVENLIDENNGNPGNGKIIELDSL